MSIYLWAKNQNTDVQFLVKSHSGKDQKDQLASSLLTCHFHLASTRPVSQKKLYRTSPTNTRRWTHTDFLLAQRLRRLPNIKQTFGTLGRPSVFEEGTCNMYFKWKVYFWTNLPEDVWPFIVLILSTFLFADGNWFLKFQHNNLTS